MVILLIQKGQWHLCLFVGLLQIIPLTGEDDCWELSAVGCIQSQLSLWEVAMITPLLVPAHLMVWIDNFHSCTCRVTLVLVELLNLPTACVSILALKFGNKWGNLLCHQYTQKPPSFQCYGMQCALSLVNRWIECGLLALSVRERLQEDVVFIWSHALRNSRWVFPWTVNWGFINFMEHILFKQSLVWMSHFVKWAAYFKI